MSFRSYTSSLSNTPSSLSHQNSANDVVAVQHLHCSNNHAAATKHCFSSQCVATLARTNNHMISCLAVHGTLLYAASAGKIDVYDLATFSLIDTFNGHDRARGISPSGLVKSIAFDGGSGKVYTAHQDCKIRVWRLKRSKRHRLVKTLPTLKDRLCRFALAKNYVVVRRHKRRLWIEHNDAVSGIATNGGLLYSVSWDRTLKVWKMSHSKCIESVLGAHDDAINAVEASTGGDGAVYTASADGTIKVWLASGSDRLTPVAELRLDNACAVNALALARDGLTLVSGSCEGEVVAWRRDFGEGPERMRARAVLSGHVGAVLCLVAFDRGMFASGSADRTVRIWGECGYGEARGFCCLGLLDGHRKPVRSLVAVEEEEGRANGVVSVVSGSLDGELKIWRVMVYDGDDDIKCARVIQGVD